MLHSTPRHLNSQDLKLARVFRDSCPIPNVTSPLVSIVWYATLREVAELFFPMGSEAWYEFMSQAGYFGA